MRNKGSHDADATVIREGWSSEHPPPPIYDHHPTAPAIRKSICQKCVLFLQFLYFHYSRAPVNADVIHAGSLYLNVLKYHLITSNEQVPSKLVLIIASSCINFLCEKLYLDSGVNVMDEMCEWANE